MFDAHMADVLEVFSLVFHIKKNINSVKKSVLCKSLSLRCCKEIKFPLTPIEVLATGSAPVRPSVFRQSEWSGGVPVDPNDLPLHQEHDILVPEAAEGAPED